MKLKLFIIGIAFLGMTSCAYKSCPTYAKNVKNVEKTNLSSKRS